jgi:hypothetical protein
VKQIERVDSEFNHNDPANWLLANRQTATDSLRPGTLDRFEQLIRIVNGTLR